MGKIGYNILNGSKKRGSFNMTSEQISKAIASVGVLNKALPYLDELGTGADMRREMARHKLAMVSDIIARINYQAGKTHDEGAELCKSVTGREFNIIYEVSPKDPSADTLTVASSSRAIEISVPVASLANDEAGTLWQFVSEHLRNFRTTEAEKSSAVELSAPLSATLDLTEEDVVALKTTEMAKDIALAGEIVARVGSLTLDPADPLSKEIPQKSRRLQTIVADAIRDGRLKPDTKEMQSIPSIAALFKRAAGELHKASDTLRELNMEPKPGEINKVEKMDPGKTPEEQILGAVFGTRKTVLMPMTAYDEVRDAEAQAVTKLFEQIRDYGIQERETGTGPIEKILGADWRIVAYRDYDTNGIEGMHVAIETPSGSRTVDLSLRELVFANSVATYNFIANDLRDVRTDEILGGKVERLKDSLYKTSMMRDEDLLKAFDDGKGPLLDVANAIILETARNCLVGPETAKFEWISGYIDHFNELFYDNDVLEKAIADQTKEANLSQEKPVPETPADDDPGGNH